MICRARCFFFQAEDGIRDLVRSRGLGDVYKRQGVGRLVDDRPTLVGLVVAEDLSNALLRDDRAVLELSLIHI